MVDSPMTSRAAAERFGKQYFNDTCSQFCKNCHRANFFVGDEIPETFVCVTCGHINKDNK